MVVIKKNILYDAQNGLKADLYFPNETTSTTKILIFWHGGGWFRGTKESVKDVGIKLANAGFMTLIPEYRLAPQYHFPAAHQDALKFVDWLLHSRFTDPDDQKNIVQIGSSVGGTMALFIACRYGFPTVTWSAPVDYSNWIQSHPQVKMSPNAAHDLGLTDPEAIREAFYKYFTLTYAGTSTKATLSQMDACHYEPRHLGKLFMINSAQELTPLSSVLTYIRFLADHNHGVQLLVIPGHGHAMDYGRDYLDESLDYLYQTLKRQPK